MSHGLARTRSTEPRSPAMTCDPPHADAGRLPLSFCSTGEAVSFVELGLELSARRMGEAKRLGKKVFLPSLEAIPIIPSMTKMMGFAKAQPILGTVSAD